MKSVFRPTFTITNSIAAGLPLIERAPGHILEHGGLTIHDYERLCPDINRRILQRDLKVLLDMGLLVRSVGSGRELRSSKMS